MATNLGFHTRNSLLVVLAFAVGLSWWPASAAIVVNSTSGRSKASGSVCNTGFLNAVGAPECTLIAAIQVAGLTPTTRDDIEFDIPTADPGYDSVHGWWAIPLVTYIRTPVRIDGYTQPGAQPNSLPTGSDAILKIQVLSTLDVYAGDCEIRGLALHNLRLLGAPRAVVSGNFFGTDPSGTTALAQGSVPWGLILDVDTLTSTGSADSLIGGPNPADRNVFSGFGYGIIEESFHFPHPDRNVYENNYIGVNAAGDAQIRNDYDGITIVGTGATVRGNVVSGNGSGIVIGLTANDTTIEDNRIGTSADGIDPLGNSGYGIKVWEHSNQGVHHIRRNRIAYNATGIVVAWNYTVGTEILSNEIFDNAGLGIDISGHGNPADPNGVPHLSGASADGIRNTIVEGNLRLEPSTFYTIQIFANEHCDPVYGYGEGQLTFGSAFTETDPNGFASFIVVAPPLPSIYHDLTATATNDSTHSTTEFSPCRAAFIDPQFDVVKTHAPDPVAVGGLLTYTIVGANRHAQDQLGVQFEDMLPAGVTFLSATPSQGSCMESSGTVTCLLIDVAAYDTVEVEIRVQPDAVGTLVNGARIGNSTSQQDVAHVVLVPPNATADFAISLVGSSSDLNPGATFHYALTARNLGPDPAEAEVEFHLPPGIIANGTPSRTSGAYDPNTGFWTTGILIPDPTGSLPETLVVPARVDPQASGCIDALATVSPSDSAATDPNEFNDSADARVGAGGCFDLQAWIQVRDQCFWNDDLFFSGFVTNWGPNTATGIVGTWIFTDGGFECGGSDGDCPLTEEHCTAAASCQLAPGETATVVREEADCDDDPFQRELQVEPSVSDYEPSNNEVLVQFEEHDHRCFIATAAWGSPLDPHVQALRDFRDRHLVTNAPGRLFVNTYYRVSPPIAAVIAQRPILRAAVRTALTPIVLAVEFPAAAAGIGLAGSGAGLLLLLAARRRRTSRRRAAHSLIVLVAAALAAIAAFTGHATAATPVAREVRARHALDSVAGLVASMPTRGVLTSRPRAETTSLEESRATAVSRAGAAPVRAPRETAASEAGAAPSVPEGVGASLADLAVASDLVVLGEVVKAAPSRSGGATLTVHVEEFLKGDHPSEEILVRANPSSLLPGDRAILFLVPALRSSPLALRARTPGRFVLAMSGRYVLLSPALSQAAEAALKGRVLASRVQQAGGPAASQSGGAAPARLAGARSGIQTSSQTPVRRGRIQFSHVRRIFRDDPDLRSDAMQARSDLLASLDQSPGSFQLDPATIDTLRDLAERLAVEATPEMQDALSSAMESIEGLEGVPLDATQISEARQFLLLLPTMVFGGRN